MAAGCGARGRGAFGGSHDTEAAGDNATDRLTRFRVLGQSGVLHTLADFVGAHLLAFMRWDGFVEVNGHKRKIRARLHPRKRFSGEVRRVLP